MHPYQHDYLVTDAHVDCFGRLKSSMLLFFCQDVAGHHCLQLGTDYDSLARKNLFWAIIRQKVQITRLPRSGETIHVQTWPMPTTRTCYPRSTVAYDQEGKELFRSIGMWVLMDRTTRAMILPGKSGVTVQGLLTGTELATPGSLSPKQLTNLSLRRVSYSDLDRNGHMNNTKYLEWMDDLLPSAFHQDNVPKEFTVCYHSEARETDELHMSWQVNEENLFQIESWRETPENGSFHRIFAAQIQYGPEIL
jgi:acyl-ACP thioesterase